LARKEIDLIKKEKKRNDGLILSSLPKPIAEKFKKSWDLTCNSVKSGSVCFVNLVGFDDAVNENHQQSLYLLGELFTTFDNLTEKFNCHKVKSFSSKYMCVSYIEDTVDTAERIALLALVK